MKKICAIISGGDYSPLENIEKADFIIACDHGYEYAEKCGIVPDLFIGDFDSFSGRLPSDIPVLELPTEKDDTDTQAAVRYAVENGFDEIVLYCALGGRFDHTFSNIQSCAYAVEHGAGIRIISESDYLFFLSNSELRIPEKNGYSLSVFALSDECDSVCITGTKYTLENATVKFSQPIGVSNEWDGEAVIKAGSGILAVIISETERNRK